MHLSSNQQITPYFACTAAIQLISNYKVLAEIEFLPKELSFLHKSVSSYVTSLSTHYSVKYLAFKILQS